MTKNPFWADNKYTPTAHLWASEPLNAEYLRSGCGCTIHYTIATNFGENKNRVCKTCLGSRLYKIWAENKNEVDTNAG